MPTRYGTSYWESRTSRRPSFPIHRGALTVDAAIVGGGLTGCAIAYAFAAAGIDVALFEADRIAGGSTSASAGMFVPDPDVPFEQISKLYGLKAARHFFQAPRRAALDLAATLRRLNIRASLESRRSVIVAPAYGDDKRLKREAKARRAAGLDAVWMTPKRVAAETGIHALGGLAAPADGQVDPRRACFGFAAAAAERGAKLFEKSPVRRIRADRKGASLKTARGDVSARVAIVATNVLGDDFRSLRRHVHPYHTYCVATEPLSAPMRRQVGSRNAVIRDIHDPPHYLAWLPEDRVIFGGADQPVVPDRLRAKVIVQRTGELMYELTRFYPEISGLRPEFGWDATSLRSVDGLPFIGPHRNFPHHLFAVGFGRAGVAHAFLASRILLRHAQGTPDKGDDIFAFNRLASERK
jgi:glycine/D-amino acid oxidase-like deaminating enzyme